MLMFSMYIMCLTYDLLYCYLFCKYVSKEKFIFSKKLLFVCSLLAVVGAVNFYYNKTILKPFISNLLEFFAIKITYNKSLIKSLLGLLISFLIASISELVFAFIAINILGLTQSYLNNTIKGFILTNMCILLIVLLLSNFEKVKKLINIILNTFEDKKSLLSALFVLLSLSIVTYILYSNLSNDVSSTYFIVSNLFFIGVYVFMIGFFVQKSNNNRLTSKYDQLIDYSKTYEQELVKRSKKQHEYKNQLVIIKSMIEDKDKEVIDYINEILNDNDKNKDIKWLTKLTNIPLGGLKGLIYYKINEMTTNGIKITLDVSESLNKKSLWKNYSINSHDISKIIGVYIDNAIEAANLSNNKEVEIQFYLEENNIVLCLGNTYSGNIDLSKIGNEGYSTKGNNRGYGLSLARDLLSKHKDILSQERTIIENYYVQKLMIKTK